MNVTVTTSVNSVHTITGASRWDVDPNGYLNIWSRNPEGVIATFAPGWLSVSERQLQRS